MFAFTLLHARSRGKALHTQATQHARSGTMAFSITKTHSIIRRPRTNAEKSRMGEARLHQSGARLHTRPNPVRGSGRAACAGMRTTALRRHRRAEVGRRAPGAEHHPWLAASRTRPDTRRSSRGASAPLLGCACACALMSNAVGKRSDGGADAVGVPAGCSDSIVRPPLCDAAAVSSSTVRRTGCTSRPAARQGRMCSSQRRLPRARREARARCRAFSGRAGDAR